MLEMLYVWLSLSVIVGVAAYSIDRNPFGWFALALIISPVIAGLILIVIGVGDSEKRLRNVEDPAQIRKCPFCAENIKHAAIVCRHCGRDIPEPTPRSPSPTQSKRPLPPSPQKAKAMVWLFFATPLLFSALCAVYFWSIATTPTEIMQSPGSSAAAAEPIIAPGEPIPLPRPSPRRAPGQPLPLIPPR